MAILYSQVYNTIPQFFNRSKEMSKADKAVETFKSDFNCSQAVLSVFCEELGLDKQAAARIASGFGGGIGHLGKTCGAVTGAVMAISLKKGMSLPESISKSNQLVYDLVGQFAEKFIERNRSSECRDLLGMDIGDPEAYKEARRQNLFYTVCTKYVHDAAEIAEEMIG